MDFWRRNWLAAVSLLAVVVLAITFGTSGPGTRAPGFSEPEKDQMREIVRDFLVRNPEVLVESLQAYQEKAQAEADRKQRAALGERRDEIERDPSSPVAGSPEGDVTVVEFMDYRCTYCKQVFPALQQLIKDDGNIRYVFKEFPILGPDSVVAARAALAVWRTRPEMYMAYHAQLMTAQGGFNEKRVLDIAADLGLDREAVAAEMKNPEIAAVLRKNQALAESLDIRGTPAFVIGGRLVPGAVSADTLRQLVAAARKG